MDAIATGAAISDYTPAALDSIKVALPKDWAALADKAPATQKALELAVAAFEAGGSTVVKDVADFKTLVPGLDTLYNKVSYRSEGLDAYIKSHPKINRTLEEVCAKSFYPNVERFFQAPVMRNGEGQVEEMTNMLPLKGTDEYTATKEKYDAEVAAAAAAFNKYLDDAGVDVILTPCTSGPPASAKTAAEYGDPASFVPLIMSSISSYSPISGLNGLPLPSITLPTSAQHEPELGSGKLPAGVLLWAREKDDKKLVEVAMALEVALAAAAR